MNIIHSYYCSPFIKRWANYIISQQLLFLAFPYGPGDILVVHPKNNYNSCKRLAELLGVELNSKIRITLNPLHSNAFSPFPKELTVLDLFENWLGIDNPPSRYMLFLMSFFAENPLHQEKLFEMSSKTKEGMEEYYAYCVREKRTLPEVIFDFNSIKIDLALILEGTPLLKPREYSLSSDYKTDKDRVSPTVYYIDGFFGLSLY
jgi:sulfite reductase alpha subunit-like flavoprotein